MAHDYNGANSITTSGERIHPPTRPDKVLDLETYHGLARNGVLTNIVTLPIEDQLQVIALVREDLDEHEAKLTQMLTGVNQATLPLE